jgi:broad specificity phosphatase PhoE
MGAGPVCAANAESVVLARHGETEWNRAGRRQGQLDSPLTERGVRQAIVLGHGVAALSIDVIFTSPLGRASATAGSCAERLRVPVVPVAELAEVDHGRMAGLTREEIEQAFPGALARRAQDKYRWRFPGGESYADADHRAGTALALIDAAGAQHPLIVSHEMIGRMLLRHLLDADAATALTWTQPHNVIYRVDPRIPASSRIDLHTASDGPNRS